MSLPEIEARTVDHIHKQILRPRWARSTIIGEPALCTGPAGRVPCFTAALPPGTMAQVGQAARSEILTSADQIMCGRLDLLGILRFDLVAPDWFRDPVTGRRAPATEYSFSIDHRCEDVTGNVKQVWELSRHQYLTVLAAAHALTDDESYACRVASHLRSWWAVNPFLSGIHWTSGIEVALRLISWVWIRRLLDAWNGAPALFEENPVARRQIRWHQSYLSRFPSRGSSANNHAIAEAAGQLVASLAFGWFNETPGWAEQSREALEKLLEANTFPSGLNREMAFEYHGFVLELGLIAAAEAYLAGRPLSGETMSLLCRMVDAGAATLDTTGRGPRYGDGDGGRVLQLGDPGASQWADLLQMAAGIFAPMDWWPRTDDRAAATVLSSMTRPTLVATPTGSGDRKPGAPIDNRPDHPPWHVADAGLTVLRTAGDRPEIWCRCDAGPHGYLSIAAHGHADALSIEVRHGGIDVLADPGTFCYHGDRSWRDYFRSTIAHNTIEVAQRDQSLSAGPFMWSRHAESNLKGVAFEPEDGRFVWSAEHHGYAAPPISVRHSRTVTLWTIERRIDIIDELVAAGRQPFRLAFHFGPDVDVRVSCDHADLEWEGNDGTRTGATLSLPAGLTWKLWRGSESPLLGWYAPSFGRRVKVSALVGEGVTSHAGQMLASLQFHG